MATFTVTTTSSSIDGGSASELTILNTGAQQAILTYTTPRGVDSETIWPGGRSVLTPLGSSVTAVTVSGATTLDVTSTSLATSSLGLTVRQIADDPAMTGSYAGIGLPSYALASPRTKRYDPSRFLYNGRSLRLWRAALARQKNGDGVARLNCYGDSCTVGYLGTPTQYQGSWATRLRDKMNTTFGNAGTGITYFLDYSDDARLAVSSNWAILNGGYGPFDVSVINAANSTARTVSFAPDVPVSSFTVYYLTTNGSGTWNINVDGGTNTAVNATAPNAPASVTISAGQAAIHTLNIIGPASGSIVIYAVEGTTSTTTGVRVTRCGKGGANPGTLVGATPSSNVGSLQLAIDAATPDLSVFMFDANAYLNSASVATFKADLATLIVRAQLVNSSVLLVPDPPNSDTTLTPAQTAYVLAMYELADQYDVAVLDVHDRWASYAASQPAPVSFYGDVTHPSNKGYLDIANAVYAVAMAGTQEQVLDTSFKKVGYVAGVSGEWYMPPAQTVGNATATAQAWKTVYYLPILLRAGTLDRLGVNHLTTVGAAGEVGRLGLYADTGTQRPGKLLVDGGTVDLSTAAAVKTVTISKAISDGLYWLAWCQQGSTSATATIVTQTSAQSGAGGSNPLVNFPANATNLYGRASVAWEQTNVAGALPETATPVASGLSNWLAIACRYA